MMDTRALRNAFGRFATGVTVITATAPDGTAAGLTANSFSSVSLEPPLLLWCLGKASDSRPVFEQSDHFAVNVLSEGQREVAQCFASKVVLDRFAGIAWRSGDCGAPMIDECVAWFECRVAARHDAGDHIIMVGEVERFGQKDGRPLLFYAGAYGRAECHPEDLSA